MYLCCSSLLWTGLETKRVDFFTLKNFFTYSLWLDYVYGSGTTGTLNDGEPPPTPQRAQPNRPSPSRRRDHNPKAWTWCRDEERVWTDGTFWPKCCFELFIKSWKYISFLFTWANIIIFSSGFLWTSSDILKSWSWVSDYSPTFLWGDLLGFVEPCFQQLFLISLDLPYFDVPFLFIYPADPLVIAWF